jgi:hypothetical protein
MEYTFAMYVAYQGAMRLQNLLQIYLYRTAAKQMKVK